MLGSSYFPTTQAGDEGASTGKLQSSTDHNTKLPGLIVSVE